jgi:FixJ family two-component response regulator
MSGRLERSGASPCAPSSPIIRVVDDNASFLKAVGRMLRASGFAVKTFASVEEFLARPELEVPGCVLADLQMPGLSGLDLQAALANAGATMPVIFLSGHGDIPTTVQAMRQGAEDFLTKRAPKEQLIESVKRALVRDARERAERLRLETLHAPFAALTPRELEVLKLVVQGKLNKEIADELGIHERTVKLHRTAITTKLDVHSAAGLTRLWMEAGETAGVTSSKWTVEGKHLPIAPRHSRKTESPASRPTPRS